MKKLALKSALSSPKDMNELVDTICKIMNQDTAILRDKFKMVTQANSKTLNDLCKHLKLKLIFDYTGKNFATVEVLVNESFDLSSITSEETKPEPEKKKESSPAKKTEELDNNSSEDNEDDPF